MQQLDLQLGGLNTNPSPFKTKPGTLSIADNINIDAQNEYSLRKGFTLYGDFISGTTPKGMFEYKDRLIALVDNTLYLDNDDAGAWASYSGSYSVVDSTIGLRNIQNNGSVFINTTKGAYKLDALANTWTAAGGIKAIGADWSLSGASGWFLNDNQVAYRVVWGYTDANEVVTLGAPSERIEAINDLTAGSTRDVQLDIYIPDGVTTSHYFQVYRSGLSGSSSVVANDELQLVYEDNPTSAQITAGVITIIDNTPDSLRGATIYTASTQEGIENANDVPPIAKDMTSYKGYAFWANTSTRHRKELTLLAVGGTSGIGIGDIVTIAGVDFTGAAAQDHTVGEFAIVTSGTVAENIADTAKSLAQVINRYATNTDTYAYYVSAYDELPGQLLIERRDISAASFSISFTNAGSNDHSKAWNPTLTSAITSNNEVKTNRIYFSKYNQFDSVPLGSYKDVGSGNSEIKRIIALRDSVFIFKDDGEIHRLVGDVVENFAVSLFDNTITIVAPKTAVTFSNQIYLCSDQGIVSISDAGVIIRSWDIQRDLISDSEKTNFKNNAFAVAYESENKYILYTDLQNSDNRFYAYVYNVLTNTWTTWSWAGTVRWSAGLLRPTENKIYYMKNSIVYAYGENATGVDYLDYSESYITKTISSSSGNTITFSNSTGLFVGEFVLQIVSGLAQATEITAVNGTTATVTDTFASWNNTTAYIGSAIPVTIKFLPIYSENPGIMKRFREMWITSRKRLPEVILKHSNNFDSTEVSATLTSTQTIMLNPTAYRSYFPLNLQRALWEYIEIQLNLAFFEIKLNGISIQYEETSERFTQ
jgi:hypothetical protein